jgi:hypothetical protein
MDPTTMPVSTGSESFWVDGDVDEPAVAAGAVDDAMATSFQKGRTSPVTGINSGEDTSRFLSELRLSDATIR